MEKKRRDNERHENQREERRSGERIRDIDPDDYKNANPKKRHSSYILLYISLAIIAVGVFITLSLTVFFPIKSIEVSKSTNCRYSGEEIVDSSKLSIGTNLFITDLSNVESNITSKLPYIKSVEVSRKFPSSIVINVKDGSASAQIECNKQYYVIDDSGKCLEVKSGKAKDVPIIRGIDIKSAKAGEKIEQKKSGDRDLLKLSFDILKQGADNSFNFTVVNAAEEQNVWATLDNRIVMLFGTQSNLDAKLKFAVEVLNQRSNKTETGTLNLSRIPNTKNQASFIPGPIEKDKKS